MKINTLSALGLGGVLMGVAMTATAQTEGSVKPTYQIPTSTNESKDGPRGIELSDGLALFPSVNTSLGRDDNLFITNTNRTSTSFFRVNPNLLLEARGESNIFKLGYDGDITRYSSSSSDNYADSRFNGSGEFVFSSSLALRLAGQYHKLHDPRGSTDRGLSAKADKFTNTGGGFLLAYGANGAFGRLEVEANTYRKSYDNNRALTQFSDRDNDSYAGRFFVRVAPKTSFLVEARSEDFDYRLSSSQQDSKEKRYFAGVTWEATAATSGTVKLGKIRKEFSDVSRSDFSSTGWEVAVQWQPLSYSKFDVFTSRTFGESTGIGNFILSKRYGVVWSHQWNSRFSTATTFNRTEDDFQNAGRNDKTNSLGLRVNYKIMRWLTVGGEYNYTDRDSNQGPFNYKRNLYLLTVGASL